MDLKIDGRKALVCAASKGLGRAIAMELALEGAEVFMCARGEDELMKAADAVRTNARAAVHAQACDVTSKDSRRALLDAVSKKLGHVDILIHNVGGPKPTTAEATSQAEWQAGFEQLFPAVAEFNGAFLPGMKERKWGRIIAVTSTSVLEPIAGLAVSNAIRSAVTAMLKTLADEVAAYNITVNCVAPGLIATDRTADLMKARMKQSGQTEEEYLKEYLKPIPAGRLGDPGEFGAVVAFLSSDRASYITGSTICVDGGKRRSTT